MATTQLNPSEISELIKNRIEKVKLAAEARNEGIVTSDFGPVEVPEGMLFMMGDNRGNSRDSRFFGPIEGDTIVGRAFLRVWPEVEADPDSMLIAPLMMEVAGRKA